MTMITIIDEFSKLLDENLKENQQHSRYSIISRFFWSKHVNEERDAPDQILLGAQKTSECILIVLSTWLEFFISKGHTENTYFAFGMNGQNYPILIKEKAADFMEKIINDDNFITIIEVKRGTYSTRKMVTTISIRCRCSKYETDTRAHWK